MRINHLVIVTLCLTACGEVLPDAPGTQRAAVIGDTCADAGSIAVGGLVTGTTEGAQDDFFCTPGPDVVYGFASPAGGAYRAVTRTDAGSWQPMPFLKGPECSNSQCLGQIFQSTIKFKVDAGTNYLVVETITPAPFTLELTQLSPPSNDTCANPAVLTVGTSVSVPLDQAFDDYGFGCGQSNSDDVTYTFTAPSTGKYLFQVEGNASLFLSSVCGQSCTSIGPSATLTLSAGTSLSVLVEGVTTAPVSLRVDQVSTPTNDTCVNAQPLSLGVDVAGTTKGANDEACSPGGDVFFRFTPPSSGLFQAHVTTVGGSPDAGGTQLYPALLGGGGGGSLPDGGFVDAGSGGGSTCNAACADHLQLPSATFYGQAGSSSTCSSTGTRRAISLLKSTS